MADTILILADAGNPAAALLESIGSQAGCTIRYPVPPAAGLATLRRLPGAEPLPARVAIVGTPARMPAATVAKAARVLAGDPAQPILCIGAPITGIGAPVAGCGLPATGHDLSALIQAPPDRWPSPASAPTTGTSTPDPSAAADASFDPSQLAGLEEADPGAASEVVDLFLADLQQVVADLPAMAECGSYRDLDQCAHRLKGSALVVGATSLVAACMALLTAARAEDRTGCQQATAQIIVEAARIAARLRALRG